MTNAASLLVSSVLQMGMAKLGHRRRLTAAIRELHMLNPMLHGDVKLPEMSDIELAVSSLGDILVVWLWLRACHNQSMWVGSTQ